MSHSIVFLEVDAEDAALVRERYPNATIIGEVLEGDALVDACRDAEVVSCFIYTQFSREVLNRLPKLTLLCTRSVGYNHIDLRACSERGITVCNVPDYGSHVIAEHVFALLLSTLRHISEADDRVELGEFSYHGLRGMALKGKTIGIVGTGKIGSVAVRIAHGFGMRILATDPHPNLDLAQMYGVQYVDKAALFAHSDIVTLHVPALPDTHHMLDADVFASMKHGVVIINTARGELIDSDALLDALKGGKVAYALLDVLEHERNFEENRELIGHPNAITTPHIAFYADDSTRNMYEDCFRSIAQWQRGEDIGNVVAALQEK